MYQVTETHNSKSKQRKENTKSNSNFKEKDAIRKKSIQRHIIGTY